MDGWGCGRGTCTPLANSRWAVRQVTRALSVVESSLWNAPGLVDLLSGR